MPQLSHANKKEPHSQNPLFKWSMVGESSRRTEIDRFGTATHCLILGFYEGEKTSNYKNESYDRQGH